MSDKVTKVKDFIKELEVLAKKQKGLHVKVSEDNFKTYDGFFKKTDHIYKSSEYWFEKVSINKTKWLKHEHPKIDTDFRLCDVDWIEELALDYYVHSDLLTKLGLPVEFEVCELTLDEIKDHAKLGSTYQEFLSIVYDELEDKDYNDLEVDLSNLYGIGCPEETFNEIEALSYWTVYFKPVIWDEDVAWHVGLIPFEFDEENYLTLAGCGMDLSPKLDAYQALTDNSVPRHSQFLNSGDSGAYAKYVVGEKIYDEVMEKIKLDVPILHINFY